MTAVQTDTVRSVDGTTITCEINGTGPSLVLVEGAMGARNGGFTARLAAALADRFTTVIYDRRGRGDSTDTAPYAPQREIEDIAALIDLVGGSAALFGMSSGGILALDTANALPDRVTRLALYEPPFIVDDSRPPLTSSYVADLDAAIAAGDRSRAVEIFMTDAIALPPEYLEGMKADPMWASMEAVAHTIAYDGRIVQNVTAGVPLPTDRWSAVIVPALVVTGGASDPFFATGARQLVERLPAATHETLAGQDHNVDPAMLAPRIGAFLEG